MYVCTHMQTHTNMNMISHSGYAQTKLAIQGPN